MKNKKVVIEVLGGVAVVAECPAGVEVSIKDYDNCPAGHLDCGGGEPECEAARDNR